ncbi:MAG: DUF6588 family protein [Bacteroidota bacterium]
MKDFKKIIFFAPLFFTGVICYGQLDIETFLEGGLADANTYLESYMEPVFIGTGYAFNSGWYNTARPHRTLGFDLTIQPSMAFVPSSAETFTFNNGDYTNLRLRDTSRDEFPTIMGANLDADDIPEIVLVEEGEETLRFTGLTGLGLDETAAPNALYAPTIQLGVGVYKNTELKIRYIPRITVGDEGQQIATDLWGVGVMHDIKQWIPGIKLLPFDLSAFLGYTSFRTEAELDEDAPDQLLELRISGMTAQAMISKEISVLTLYGGIGFSTSISSLKVKGTFETEDEDFVDPIDFNYTSMGPRINAGFRVKLFIFTLHAEYALQQYSTVTAGFGFSYR